MGRHGVQPVTRTLRIKYELGHTYDEVWRIGRLHCPFCGEKGVWEEQDAGDYYVGPGFLCAKCGTSFTMPTVNTGKGGDWQLRQRVECLASAEKSARPEKNS